MAKRRNHAPDFKAKVALAALSGNKTVAELSTEYGVHQTQINRWVKQLKDNAPRSVFRRLSTRIAPFRKGYPDTARENWPAHY